MNLTLLLLTDNITEILIKIVEFTHARQKVLIGNINNIGNSAFTPKDLAVDEFSSLLTEAIKEHTQNQRLMFCDTDNIKFNVGFTFEAMPVIDEYAQKLLRHNPDEFLELQINKLLENTLNQQIATELLRQKEQISPSF